MATEKKIECMMIDEEVVAGKREETLLHIIHDNDDLIDFALSLICQIELEQKKEQTPAFQESAV